MKELKKKLTTRVKDPVVKPRDLVSCGSSQLNLACSGYVTGGFPKGRYILLGGVSDAAKTWLGLSVLAEASINPEFDDYDLIYDTPEEGASMDKAYFFGDRLKQRIRPLIGTRKRPDCSRTVEQFYDAIDERLEEGKPFICLLDSETALTIEADLRKQAKQKKARQGGKEEKGSYQTEKAKEHARRLRVIRPKLKDTGSILIFISQLRDRIGFGAQFEPKYRPGGTALSFFAEIEIWMYVKKTIKTVYRGKKRQQGMIVLAKVKRTRLTGKKQSATISIYHDSGIDDVGDCVNFLVDEKCWKAKKGIIRAEEFGKKMHREELIQYIERENLEPRVRTLVKRIWKEIEEAVALKRKFRYV